MQIAVPIVLWYFFTSVSLNRNKCSSSYLGISRSGSSFRGNLILFVGNFRQTQSFIRAGNCSQKFNAFFQSLRLLLFHRMIHSHENIRLQAVLVSLDTSLANPDYLLYLAHPGEEILQASQRFQYRSSDLSYYTTISMV